MKNDWYIKHPSIENLMDIKGKNSIKDIHATLNISIDKPHENFTILKGSVKNFLTSLSSVPEFDNDYETISKIKEIIGIKDTLTQKIKNFEFYNKIVSLLSSCANYSKQIQAETDYVFRDFYDYAFKYLKKTIRIFIHNIACTWESPSTLMRDDNFNRNNIELIQHLIEKILGKDSVLDIQKDLDHSYELLFTNIVAKKEELIKKVNDPKQSLMSIDMFYMLENLESINKFLVGLNLENGKASKKYDDTNFNKILVDDINSYLKIHEFLMNRLKDKNNSIDNFKRLITVKQRLGEFLDKVDKMIEISQKISGNQTFLKIEKENVDQFLNWYIELLKNCLNEAIFTMNLSSTFHYFAVWSTHVEYLISEKQDIVSFYPQFSIKDIFKKLLPFIFNDLKNEEQKRMLSDYKKWFTKKLNFISRLKSRLTDITINSAEQHAIALLDAYETCDNQQNKNLIYKNIMYLKDIVKDAKIIAKINSIIK